MGEQTVWGRRRWVRRSFGAGLVLAGGLMSIVAGSNLWLRIQAAGHLVEASSAPTAPVVMVPGAKVGPDGMPMAYLRGRLDAAIELLAAEKVREILISGDAEGNSGDEIASMTKYLLDHGVDPALIRPDAQGLSTRATCERAHAVFGIDRALIVTQHHHLPRAVFLCRAAGIDADGVAAYCECRRVTVVRNTIREWLAAPKAVFGSGLRDIGHRPARHRKR